MPNYKKRVRDALKAVLSDATVGFNVKLAALEVTYNIQPFSIDFDETQSLNFLTGFITEDSIEMSDVIQFPALVMYTSRALDDKKMMTTKFSGQVVAHLDFYLRFRALTDPQHTENTFEQRRDYEALPDAVEDAVKEMLVAGRSIFNPTHGVNQIDYEVNREPIQLAGDGYTQRVAFTLGFEVHVS
jgi:hypothetical protein